MKGKLKEIINTVLDNANLSQIETLEGNMHLRNDLQMDSLNLAELTVRIEEEFGVDIFEDEYVATVDQIINILKSNE